MKFDPFPLVLTSFVTLALFALLCYLAITGWPGETGVSALSFCETLRPGPVKQPANTWSNLGFVAVAIAIAIHAGRDLARPKSPHFANPVVTSRFFTTTYAISGTLIGMGSGAMHASTTAWGGQVDIYSMFLWATWAMAYSGMRLVGRREAATFLCFFVPIATLLAAEVFVPLSIGGFANAQLFGLLVVLAISLELVTLYRLRHRYTTTLSYLGWAVAFFLAAYAAWLPSRTGGPLCYPNSLWQGHGLWHILCSGSVLFVYLYGRSERLVEQGMARNDRTHIVGRQPTA